jgi:hypothetical protein
LTTDSIRCQIKKEKNHTRDVKGSVMRSLARFSRRSSAESAAIVLLCVALVAFAACSNCCKNGECGKKPENGGKGGNQIPETTEAPSGSLCLENALQVVQLESMRTKARKRIVARRQLAAEDAQRFRAEIDLLGAQLKRELGDETRLEMHLTAIERAPETLSRPQRALMAEVTRLQRHGELDGTNLDRRITEIKFKRSPAITGSDPVPPGGAAGYEAILGDEKPPTPAEPDGGLTPFCSGTLIGPNWILAAAHCAPEVGDVARVGATDPNSGEAREIVRTCTHPDYVEDELHHDAVLVQLAASTTSDPVPVVDIEQSPGLDQPPGLAALFGFGKSDYTTAEDGILHRGDVPLVEGSECNHEAFDPELMICAGGEYEGEYRGPCEMDSGSGLLACVAPGGCETSPDSWRVIGVTNFIVGACLGQPGVFARVSAIDEWIDEVLADDPGPNP